MSTEDNKTAVRQFIKEVFNKRILDYVVTSCAPTIILHGLPSSPSGIEVAKRSIGMYLAAFPDLHFTCEDLIAEGDKVVARETMSGAQQGELMGIPRLANSSR